MNYAEASVTIARRPDAVFQFVDDFAKAPSWLESCVELRQISGGPRAAGTPLHYAFLQDGRRGEMHGAVSVYDKPQQLEMKFSDRSFAVVVSIRCIATDTGTVVTHRLTIIPLTFFGKLMAPLIRAANRRQVASNMARLKVLLERSAS